LDESAADVEGDGADGRERINGLMNWWIDGPELHSIR
jgi:hypothetical protein